MKFKGWTNDLPSWIIKAIDEGKLQVKQAKDHDYLEGKVINPQGTIIKFN